MPEKTKIQVELNTVSIQNVKKTWIKPNVEIISHIIQSGQRGPYTERTFIGASPFSLYHS